MSDLILIRHANSALDPAVNSHDWELSAKGVARCQSLADHLQGYGLARLVTSHEPKAVQTGQIVAQALQLPVEQAPGLEEQHRRSVGWYTDEAQRLRDIQQFFAQPEAVVFGEESAAAAHQRFAGAIQALQGRYPGQTLGVVTHGTVMALFLQQTVGLDAFAFWQTMGLPMFVALTGMADGGYRLERIVRDVAVSPE